LSDEDAQRATGIYRESPNAERLRELQQLIKDRVEIRRLVEAVFDQEIG